ncbi:hypothetical protein CSHISOI_03691 [Colletotrichum shisoi]|uniref:Uncharacterized protein n=1 Tax=Colletotrichum shisoi TaxID=2078593 RepID=A0A5Q4BXH9_9PEZI|nr:hypothetical protein CSHISOI_03691 [Colletotrichum shisoi]
MASSFGLFSLPRKLRDMVYEHYFAVAGGYVCDSQSFLRGKLRKVAVETKGLPFRANAITFKTVTSQNLGALAFDFSFVVHHLDEEQDSLFRSAGRHVTREAHDDLRRRYPQFAPLLDRLRADRGYFGSFRRQHSYGEVPSVYREFCRDTLQALSLCNPDALDILPLAHRSALRTLTCPIHHWVIPSQDDVNRLFSNLHETSELTIERRFTLDGIQRLSAAAVAIHFMGSLPAASRRQLRDVVLDEDHEAVALPECHGRGLIPFCQENPQLRIQRRLKLWQNFFPAKKTVESCIVFMLRMTDRVSRWMVEARALPSAGMPAASFSLLLDGSGPVSQHFYHAFQLTVQRDAAWQLAWTASQERRDPPVLSWFDRRVGEGLPMDGYFGYFYEDFPAAMRDIVNDDPMSIARCNFDVGEPWDIGNPIPGHQAWSIVQWNAEWHRHDNQWWEVVSSFCTS